MLREDQQHYSPKEHPHSLEAQWWKRKWKVFVEYDDLSLFKMLRHLKMIEIIIKVFVFTENMSNKKIWHKTHND